MSGLFLEKGINVNKLIKKEKRKKMDPSKRKYACVLSVRVYKLYQCRYRLIYTVKSAVEYLSTCGMPIPGPANVEGA